MREVSYTDWITEGELLFGKNRKDWKFVCPNCGHVQTAQDFLDAGIDRVETKIGYSCIGRWIKSDGQIGNKKSPCNYAGGGLFQLNPVAVTQDDIPF